MRQPNEYHIIGEEVWIILTDKQGNYRNHTIIDKEDLKSVSKHRWSYDGQYATTEVKRRKIYLHHFVLDMDKEYLKGLKLQIDHFNRDSLYNCKENLRLRSKGTNQRNVGPRVDNTSGFRGVYYRKDTRKWFATIGINGKYKRLGTYKKFKDAVKARIKADITAEREIL